MFLSLFRYLFLGPRCPPHTSVPVFRQVEGQAGVYVCDGTGGKGPVGMISEVTVLETSGQAGSKVGELIGVR